MELSVSAFRRPPGPQLNCSNPSRLLKMNLSPLRHKGTKEHKADIILHPYLVQLCVFVS